MKKLLIIFVVFYQMIDSCIAQESISDDELNAVVESASFHLRQNKLDFEYLKIRGSAYFLLKKYEDAIIDFRNAASIKDDKEVLYHLALSYSKMDKYTAAEVGYSSVINLDSSFVEAFLGRGYAYLQNKKYNLALKDLNYYLNTKGESFEVCLNLGRVYMMLGNLSKSQTFFEKAMRFENNNPYLYYYKAVYSMKSKEIKNMCANYLLATKYGLPSAFDEESISDSIKKNCN